MMVKKMFLLAFLIISTNLFAQGFAADEQSPPPPPGNGCVWPWTLFPWLCKSPPPPPPPSSPGHQSPTPAPGTDVGKCFGSFATQVNCLQDIINFILTQKPSIGPDCCRAILAAHDDCLHTILDQFNDPLLAPLLKDQCSKQGGAAPPPA